MKLHNAEPIVFDQAAATSLAKEFRTTAALLREQVPHRQQLAKTASKDWQGAYEVKFGARMKIYAADAERLAAAMDTAAAQVDELARLAGEEQARRATARDWKKRHDHWEHHRSIMSYSPLSHDHGPKPPNLKPAEPPKLPIHAPAPASRK
jgi:uncharacterized protein YukE